MSEERYSSLVSSLHNISFDYDEGLVTPVEIKPTITRSMNDIDRDNQFLVIEFMPTGKRYTGLSSFNRRRENDEYVDSGYGYEVLVRVTAMSNSVEVDTNFIHGRKICRWWLDIVEKYIKYKWENVSDISLLLGSFTLPVELQNWFAGKQFVYETTFRYNTHHGWSNEPTENPRQPPDVVGVELDDVLVWIESI